jgi:predicted ATPase
MIQRLRFDGYRLLDAFEADLGQLTVVIGANATGKSSLLDALSLVTQGMEVPIEDAIGVRGGMWSIPNSGRDCDEIGWQLTFSKPADHPIWSKIPIASEAACVYEARVGRDRAGRMTLRSERLRYEKPRPGKDYPFRMLELAGKTAKIFDPKTGKLTQFDQPETSQATSDSGEDPSAIAQPPVQKASLILAHMRFEHQFPIPTWVRWYLTGFCYYPGFEVSRGSLVRTNPAEIRPSTTLSSNGDNLGAVLHEYLTRHDLRSLASELRDFLKAAYPHVEDISAETAYGGEPRVLVRIREAGLRRATEIWELSDGMLRFLLLCGALLNPLPGLIAVDEPETGLHPKLLPIVADLIRSASERTQVLICTHSPQLLTAFSLDDIAVITREGARAAWYRPGERDTLRLMLESQLGGTLGELHSSGELEALA